MKRTLRFAIPLSAAIWLLILAPFLHAQSTVSLSGPPTARPGTTVTLSLAGAASITPAAALQWTLTLPSGYSGIPTAGAAATTAGKSLYCGTAACLVTSTTNVTPLGPGVLATYSVQIPATAAAGPIAFPLAGMAAADATGSALVVTAGVPYSLTILAKSDINGDGKTDTADVTAMISQVTGGACTNDQNGDGKCDVVDAVLVLLQAIGGR